MFIYSMRASTVKFVSVILLSVVGLVALLALIPTYEPTAANLLYSNVANIKYDDIKSEDDLVAFLSQFGWTVEKTPHEEREVTIPDEFDKVFTAYNELQKQQGLDLSKYRRKSVKRYTYVITNFPDYDGTVYANLLVYRGKIIGGDICTADVNGFVRGFDGVVGLSLD